MSAIVSIKPKLTTGSGMSLHESFLQRRSSELVIGFAGPIGSGIRSIINLAEDELRSFGYVDVVKIKLSDLLDQISKNPSFDMDGYVDPPGSAQNFARYRRLQQAGMRLRALSGNPAILAEYAIQEITVFRETKFTKTSSSADVPPRVVYLIDQIKRPEEVKLLRAVYRNLFYLVGVTRTYAKRETMLIDEGVKVSEVADLMEIDRNENSQDGQRLDKTLFLANYFLSSESSETEHKKASIKRFLGLVHGDRSITPTSAERGMYAAYSAGLSSACMSRQVGAAIVNEQEEVLSTGCNDVPKGGGGLYTASDGVLDYRCVKREEQYCFNDHHKRELQREIGVELEKFLNKIQCEGKPIQVPTEEKSQFLNSIYERTRLGSLIEFSRAVHAEMDALVALARNGGAGVRGASLYTTTFPCHSCARHIVAAGIKKVYYVEPYEKSLAKNLHDDSISFEYSVKETQQGGSASTKKVQFLHFEGVSPHQYGRFFKVQSRKDVDGRFVKIEQMSADKPIAEYLDDYRDFEIKAVAHFQTVTKSLNLQKVDKQQ